MSGICAPPINNLPATPATLTEEILRLQERGVFIGLLSDIIEPDGEDIILARIEDTLVEVPRGLSEKLWGMVGQRAVIGLFDGQYLAGRCSI